MLTTSKENNANKIWDAFETKHSFYQRTPKTISPPIANNNTAQEIDHIFLQDDENFEKLKKIIFIQRYWKKITNQDTLINVLPSNHLFHDFFGKEKVKKSINVQKLNQMEQAIKDNNWDHPIFQDTGYSLTLNYMIKPTDEEISKYKLYLYYVDGILECAANNEHGDTKRFTLSDKLVTHKENIIKTLSDPAKKNKLNREEEKIIFNITAADMGIRQETVPYLALSLLISNKISSYQFITILERHQMFKDYSHIKTYKILDGDHQFTEDAKQILLITFQTMRKIKPLSNEQIESFRLLVMNQPPSEQIFYCTELGDTANPTSFSSNLANSFDTIVIYQNQLINLSNSAEHALGLARFGLEDYEVPVPRLGSQSLNDIEQSVRKGERPQAIHYPDTTPYGTIHTYKRVPFFVAARHDFGHALGQSCIPKPFLKAFNHMIDVTRKYTQLEISKEMWSWIDRDYNYFLANQKTLTVDLSNLANSTKAWCNMLSYGDADPHRVHDGSLIKPFSQEYTAIGAIIYLDMIKNPDKWRDEFRIDPESLSDKHKIFYELIKKIYPNLKNDLPAIQVFKCELYENLKNKDEFTELNKVINKYNAEIVSLLQCKKYKNNNLYHKKNMIYFSFNNLPTEFIRGEGIADFIETIIKDPVNNNAKLCGLIDKKFLLSPDLRSHKKLHTILDPCCDKERDDLKMHCGLNSEHIQTSDDLEYLATLICTFKISTVKQIMDAAGVDLTEILHCGVMGDLAYYSNELTTLLHHKVMSFNEFKLMSTNDRKTLCELLRKEAKSSTEHVLMNKLCDHLLSWQDLVKMTPEEVKQIQCATSTNRMGM